MKKYTKLALVICSVIMLSACTPNNSNNNIASVTPTASPTTAPESKSSFSLKELLSQNIAQKCTWQVSAESGDSQGEILISGNKFKQIIKVKNPMGETEFNTLSDGTWYYTWSNDSTTGNMAFKMKIDQVQSPSQSPTAQSGGRQIDMDQKFEYNCQPTTISDQDLSVPSDIKFTDYSQLIKQMSR